MTTAQIAGASLNKVRAALRSEFGSRRYQIRGDGNVYVYGRMPNTGMTDWYLLGHVESVELANRLGLDPSNIV